MNRILVCTALLLALDGVAVGQDQTQPVRTLLEWRFDASEQWNGWWPNSGIRNPSFSESGVAFESAGHDPQINSPHFDLATAGNDQWVEIDLESSAPGHGELFYTNTNEGQYGGLREEWMAPIAVPAAGDQTIRIWPFWGSLQKIIRLRFDPPSGIQCTLRSIRIVETTVPVAEPAWTFGESPDSWLPMYAARIERTVDGLIFTAVRPQAMIMTPVKPFEAGRHSLLKIELQRPANEVISLYWASDQQNGLFGEPILVPGDENLVELDLRRFPMWKGTITRLALAFGTHGGEVLRLRRMAITPNDPDRTLLRAPTFGFERAINRPGQPARLKITIEHVAGPAMPAGQALLSVGGDKNRPMPIPAIQPNESVTVTEIIVPPAAGGLAVKLETGGQVFTRTLRVDEPVAEPIERPTDGYDVPVPRPVKTDYQIGIYYFPGWYPERGRWVTQKGFPERDSILGWYREGDPVVADWHIKWAIENGISFFVYDWYWRDGKEELYHGLNEGLLKARYRDQLKFAVMWANHAPYADHTLEQLLEVTDYWIEHYFRRSNYLTVDGRPYVSFFAPGMLLTDLGSEEKVREALQAMRDRTEKAGLPGIHFGACSGIDIVHAESMKRCGFDSIAGYNYRRTGATTLHSPYRQFLLGHEAVWDRLTKADVLPYTPLLTVGWDSRPWHGPAAERRYARRTEDFAEALRRLKAHLDATGRRMAILEAWNEWGEGSYIEPNVEFGFGDVEAVRKTFARPGDWPTNIAPDDLGIVDRYDYRYENNKSSAIAPHRITIPDPREGRWDLEIIVQNNQLTVDDKSLHVSPAEVVEIRNYPVKLIADQVKSWHGGNRLPIGHTDKRNITPGAYVPGSLSIRDPARPRVWFSSPRDYIVDDTWGAFEIPAGSRLKPGQEVLVSYRMSLRRIDSLYLDSDGQFRLFRGEPSPDCPKPVVLRCCMPPLANIYRPFHADVIEPHHVYTPSRDQLMPPPIINTDRLERVLASLRQGEDVTIVCWGDSVTVGGDSSSPETSYVGLFASMLKERFPKAKIAVINAGIGGSNTRQRFPDFQTEVLDHKPDLVTLEFVNDMGMPDAEMKERYPKILEAVRNAGAELLIMTPHFTRPDWMRLPHGRGVDPRTAVAFLRRFARENGVPLADASMRWQQLEFQGIPYETLLKNGINHPDDRGHRIFAEELMRYFPAE